MARIQYVAKLAVDRDTGLPVSALEGQEVVIVRRGTTTPAAISEDEAGTLLVPGAVRTVSSNLFIPSFWVDTSEGPVSALGGGIEVPLESVEGVAKRLDALEPQFGASVAAAEAAQAAAEAATTGVVRTVNNTPPDASGNVTVSGGGAGGTSDHGALAGLGDDDHPQYLNNTRGDARYYTKGQVDTLVNNAASQNSAADRNRANHTGTQAISTISGLQTILDGLGGTAVNSVAGKTGNVTLVAADISDSGATGRELMGATTAAAARTTLGAAATSHTHPATAISDSTSTGRGVLTAASASAARAAIGAGTSDLALGTTGSTAMRGNAIVIDPVSTAGLPDGTLIARTS